MHSGEFGAAARLIDEADTITQATGIAPLGYTSLVLAAWRGQEGHARELIGASIRDAATRGEGRALSSGRIRGSGAAQRPRSLSRRLRRSPAGMRSTTIWACIGWALTELIEAGTRTGQPEAAAAALQKLD